MKHALDTKEILGVRVTSASMSDILQFITRSLDRKDAKMYIVTPNPEIVMHADSHPKYKNILNQAHISIPDGIGVIIAGRILGKSLIGRITGVDLMENLCKEMANQPITVGFLGGRGNVAKSAADCLSKKYPGLKVSYAREEWDKTKIVGKSIDILFVAFGFPKQEEWISKNLPNIPVNVAMGVGGAFDYFSGEVSRAPKILRLGGLEWLYRLIQQPWRIKRQLALVSFVYLTLKTASKKLQPQSLRID